MQCCKLIVDEEICLKEIEYEDAGIIFKIIDSERNYMSEWLPFTDYTVEISDTQKYINSLIANGTNTLTFCILHNNSFAGLVGFKDPDYDNKKTEIGYWLSEKHQHKGIITRSCRKLIEFAFTELDMNRIQLKVATENVKSKKVALRLGFKHEGIERDGELHKSGFVDLDVYSLLKKENQ